MKGKNYDSNFLPNIRCPFCSKVSPYAISGFSGELSVRQKECPKCKREFVMVVYASSSIPEVDIDDTDSIIAGLRLRIKWLREQRRKTKGQLLLEHNEAKKVYDKALEQAREMARKRGMN